MKAESLGLNHWLSLSARFHTIRHLSPAWSSGKRRTAPPQVSSGMPRCCRYQAASAALSPLHLRKTPPIPVTLAIVAAPSRECVAGLSRSRRRREEPLHVADRG